MSDILGTLKALLDFVNGLGRPARSVLLQPLATVLLLLALYAGWHVQDEGNVARGLRVAFLDTRSGRAARDRELEAAILRAELYQAAESDRLINQLLTALRQRTPHAARVRLGVIHNGVSGITGIGLLRYDVTNAVAAAGHSAGETMQNQPLSEWSELLPKLLSGHCEMAEVRELANLISRIAAAGHGRDRRAGLSGRRYPRHPARQRVRDMGPRRRTAPGDGAGGTDGIRAADRRADRRGAGPARAEAADGDQIAMRRRA